MARRRPLERARPPTCPPRNGHPLWLSLPAQSLHSFPPRGLIRGEGSGSAQSPHLQVRERLRPGRDSGASAVRLLAARSVPTLTLWTLAAGIADHSTTPPIPHSQGLLGTQPAPIDESHELPGPPLPDPSSSRLWAGVHFQLSCAAGKGVTAGSFDLRWFPLPAAARQTQRACLFCLGSSLERRGRHQGVPPHLCGSRREWLLCWGAAVDLGVGTGAPAGEQRPRFAEKYSVWGSQA